MDKVIIKDLLANGILGINQEEREKPQEILINLEIYGDFQEAGITDNIELCINYSTVSKKILAAAETSKRYTVEALAEDIATLILSDSRVEKACVRVEKPHASRYARSVGVEIERYRIH
jgi:FolB domain-containing protein